MLRAYGVTDKGRVRPTNEDCFGIHDRLPLCVVADGMGGHNAGEVAARIAVDAVVDFLREQGTEDDAWPFGFDPSLSEAGNRLRTAIHVAHVRILETSATAREYLGMGTTVVAALVCGARLSAAHVGDSRLYVFARNRLRQLTHDDSWMATLLADDPQADRGLLKHHPMRNALTNVVGGRPRTQVHVVEEALDGGELLVLTTDGVHGVLEDRRIERLLRDGGDAPEMAASLIGAALAYGSRDNCTAVVAQYLAD